MVEWANEELSVLEAHLAFFKLGEARIFDGRSHRVENDVTNEYIAMIERLIEEWTALMAQHNIPFHSARLQDRSHHSRRAA